MRTLRKIRRALYRGGAVLGDVNAVGTAFERGTPKPVVDRVVRKYAYRKAGGALQRGLRWFLR